MEEKFCCHQSGTGETKCPPGKTNPEAQSRQNLPIRKVKLRHLCEPKYLRLRAQPWGFLTKSCPTQPDVGVTCMSPPTNGAQETHQKPLQNLSNSCNFFNTRQP